MLNVKTGKVTTINKGDTTITPEKRKFLKYIDLYEERLHIVSTSIEVLYLFIKDKEVNKLLGDNLCPAFFGSYINNALIATVTTLAGIFSNDKYSLNRLINYIKSNHNKIFTNDFYDITDWSDGTTTEKQYIFEKDGYQTAVDCDLLIEENGELIDKIKRFRNGKFAHFDDSDELKNMNLELNDLKKALELFNDVYNKIRVRYDRVHFDFKPVNATDVKELARVVNLYLSNKVEINKFLLEKKYKIRS